MNRRNFLRGLAGILAAGSAPAVIGSGILMPVRRVVTPELYVFPIDAMTGLDLRYTGPSGVALARRFDQIVMEALRVDDFVQRQFCSGDQWPEEARADRIVLRRPKLIMRGFKA